MTARTAGGTAARLDVPRWVGWSSLPVAVAGLGVSAYLTAEHYSGNVTLACPETGAVNCVKVTTSPYSVILGVPVAVLGLLFFAAMVLWCLPAVWRVGHPLVRYGRLGAAVVGIGFVGYLVFAELSIGAICLWCTAVHVLTLALLLLVLLGTAAAIPTAREP